MTLTSKRYPVQDASEAIEFCYEQGWTDGLPVVPPTEERVAEFLSTTRRQPSEVLGVVPERGSTVTLEKVAVNAVMAGCLPEHFPVVLAAVEAMLEPGFNVHANTASTMGAATLIIVNGPVRNELGFNSAVNVFGPGARANATVGRAIRLFTMNVLRGAPGILDKSTFGHAGKYAFCIAEDEEHSPWAPLHVERGLRPEDSAVTIVACRSGLQLSNAWAGTPEQILDSVARALRSMATYVDNCVVVLSPELRGYVGAWPKAKVQEYLWERSKKSWEQAIRLGTTKVRLQRIAPDGVVAVTREPRDLLIVAAGGSAGAFFNVIPSWGGSGLVKAITHPIEQAP